MTEAGSEVGPGCLLHTGKFPSQLLKDISSAHFLSVSVACGVDSLIKGSKQDLTQIQNTGVNVFCSSNLVTHIIGKSFSSFVVRRNLLEDALLPSEVLEHLRGGFNKISFDSGTSELNVLGVGTHHMHNVTKLVEESDDIRVGEEGRGIFAWLREVADAGSDGQLSCSRVLGIELTAALLESEACSMAVFTLTREEV